MLYVIRNVIVTDCGAGEGEDASNVPHDIGTLELVIRHVEEVEMDDIIASNRQRATRQKKKSVHKGYKRAQELYGAPAEDEEDTFSDWKNPKPRHTHTAECVKFLFNL